MDLVRESLGITIVFALLWAALWLLKRTGNHKIGILTKRTHEKHSIEVIDKIRLTPQHSLHVVRVADRQILVGLHSSGFTLLGDCPEKRGSDTKATAAGIAER